MADWVDATFVDSDTFTVAGDRTDDFDASRAMKADQGVDGEARTFVESAAYDGVVDETTVNVIDTDLTSYLARVQYGPVGVGDMGSLPLHNHQNDGQGGDNVPDYIRFDETVRSPQSKQIQVWNGSSKLDGIPYDTGLGEPDLVEGYYLVSESGADDFSNLQVPAMGAKNSTVNPCYNGLSGGVISHYGTVNKVYTEDTDGTDIRATNADVRIVGVDKTPDFDSGWTAVSVNATITETHGLGTEPSLVSLEVGDAADGSGARVPQMATDYLDANWHQSSVVEIGSSDITMRFKGALFSAGFSTGTLTPTSGYYRLKAWDWTPDYDSGWVPISSGNEAVSLRHNLGQSPRIVWMYFGTTNDYTGDTLIALDQFPGGYNEGVQIQDVNDDYIQVQALSANLAHYVNAGDIGQQPNTGYIKVHAWY